jgi:hypothetical protein
MWALEGRSASERIRRTTIWWVVAALGQFFANGAFLVTPACGLFLLIAAWRRDGLPAAVAVVRSSALWIVSFGAHYLLSVRYTHGSSYLHRNSTNWERSSRFASFPASSRGRGTGRGPIVRRRECAAPTASFRGAAAARGLRQCAPVSGLVKINAGELVL